jgi:hypothetical protein|tara:strand:+ start:2993 stop:3262 length:270 start_codon:yes stop_codon:yes gene_type:complete
MSDEVNHPKHYTQNDIECIDYIKQQLGNEFPSYLEGCIIKYVHRYKHKQSSITDLQKAKWYLNKLIEYTSQNPMSDFDLMIADEDEDEL